MTRKVDGDIYRHIAADARWLMENAEVYGVYTRLVSTPDFIDRARGILGLIDDSLVKLEKGERA